MCRFVSLVIGERKCQGVYTCFPGDRGEEVSECVLLVIGERKCQSVYFNFPGNRGEQVSGCVHLFSR